MDSWSLAKRVSFRFVFVYLVLYCFPSPLESFPKAAGLYTLVARAWNATLPWVAANVLRLPPMKVVVDNAMERRRLR